jgi:PncC family amidohydrolase
MAFTPSEVAFAIAARLIERGETVGVAESSTGGLVSAQLLAVPGASAYYLGGATVYTLAARTFVDGAVTPPERMRGATEAFAAWLAESVAGRLGATWGVAETGATGPTGNRYGDPAGHSCVAVWGPGGVRAATVATGSDDRVGNMVAFADAALDLLGSALDVPQAS